jgi:hypothetical protein
MHIQVLAILCLEKVPSKPMARGSSTEQVWTVVKVKFSPLQALEAVRAVMKSKFSSLAVK